MNQRPTTPSFVRASARFVAVVAACGVLVTSMAPATLAQPGPDPALIEALLTDPDSVSLAVDPLAGSSALEGALALIPESVRDVPVVGAAVQRTETEIVALETSIVGNRAIRDRAIADLARLEGERQGHRALISAERERRRVMGREAEQLRAEVAELAVAAYVGAGSAGPPLNLSAEEANEAGRQRVLMEAVDGTLRGRLAATEDAISASAAKIEDARAALDAVVGQIARSVTLRDDAIAVLEVAEPALPIAQERYRDQFMMATVEGADFSVVALDAYRSAANRIGEDQPNCRLSWSVLAGIARVESRHGTYGGASVRPDGTTSRRIIGIALDGSPGIMLIPDTDGGALDGDATYDRAVGPMQFIPTTWRMVRSDGNGNGRMDPHNMYDASLAAAAYLCRSGPRLDLPGPLNRAVLTYNRSQPYVDTVLSHRRSYDRLRLPEGPELS